jgi:diphthamide biosynthesis protein 3
MPNDKEISQSFHDEVEIEDFEFDEELQLYYYPCPCGDRFEITK